MRIDPIPPVSVIIPKVFSQLPKENYKNLVSNNHVRFISMIRLISFRLVKRVASLCVDELHCCRGCRLKKYSFKNFILILESPNSGHITLESISSLSTRSIGLALLRLMLRYSTKPSKLYSENYPTSRRKSLCQNFEGLHQMALNEKELDIHFLPNLS